MEEVGFLSSLYNSSATMWNASAVRNISKQQFPEQLLGNKKYLLRSDIFEQWSSWFIEGLVDPISYSTSNKGYTYIYADALKAITNLFPHNSTPEQRELSSLVANEVFNRVELIRKSLKRIPLEREQRILLLNLSGEIPRCWICGVEFLPAAVDNFRNRANTELALPSFVDYLKPIGLKSQDLRIEADHVHAFSAGGGEEDNLKLACGWCNRHKSSLQSLYQVVGEPIKAGRNRFSITTLPQRFWVVRLLALSNKCEYKHGCTATSATHEMTVHPLNANGSPNPNNLRVTCLEHDPLINTRLLPRDTVLSLWKSNSYKDDVWLGNSSKSIQ